MKPPLPPEAASPHRALRERLLELAEALSPREPAQAQALRAAVETWWTQQTAWNERVAGMLSVHHEINNALVGVLGNTQLLMMGPAGQQPGVRERLEVMLRESGRIQEAALRLRELKAALADPDPVRNAV